MGGTTHLYSPYGLPNATITTNWLANIIVAAFFTTLGFLVIALRLLTTLILRRRAHGNDDWAIYAAYTASLGYTIASLISLRYGVGLLQEEVGPLWNVQALKATYAVELFYYLSIFLVKMSILFMYLRIYSRSVGRRNPFRRATLATMAVLIAHFVSTIVVAAVQCVPMKLFWDPQGAAYAGIRGHCINITAFFYSTNVFTIVTDLVILALPMHTLCHMQMPWRRKAGFIAAVAVGGVSTIASCVRLYSVKMFMSTSKGLENAAPINTWSFVEINTAISCASVPAIGALFLGRKNHARNANLHPSSNDCKRPAARSWRRPYNADSTLFRDDEGDEEALELGEGVTPLEIARLKPQRKSQLGLRSAIMTTSRGSLRNYTTGPA